MRKRLPPKIRWWHPKLGRAYLNAGMYNEALAEFSRAMALAPDNPQAVANRGVALAMLKQTDAARADFDRALKLDACHFESRFNLKQMGAKTQSDACRYTKEQQAALDGLR